jgi:hypothetical protein
VTWVSLWSSLWSHCSWYSIWRIVSRDYGFRNVIYLVWAACCWSVRKECNNHIIEIKALSKDQLVGNIKMVSGSCLNLRKKDFSFDCHQCGWILPFVWASINWSLVCGEGLVVSRGISIFYAVELGANKLLYSFSLKIRMCCGMARDFS